MNSIRFNTGWISVSLMMMMIMVFGSNLLVFFLFSICVFFFFDDHHYCYLISQGWCLILLARFIWCG